MTGLLPHHGGLAPLQAGAPPDHATITHHHGGLAPQAQGVAQPLRGPRDLGRRERRRRDCCALRLSQQS